ncbi:MAG: Polar amino acid ABC transporter, inner membrane subunit [Acetothermia bacterium 64_32]|nr:MAG: Polar amino acid ABC transporter, inner membrane subunit [Acetothermia bacterium 64_32]
MGFLGQLGQVGHYLPMLLRASLVNLELLWALLLIGFSLGTLVALLQVYGGRLLGTLAYIYEWVFRSVPALVLLFLFYYGPSHFGLDIQSFLAACLALGFRSSAYQSQIFRGAIQAIPTGQMVAARALGMSRPRAILHVILPQAFRLAIPGWSNEFSSVTKDTTLAYAVGLNEIMRYAKIVMDRQYELAMATFIVVALVFLAFTYSGNALLGQLERRFRIPGLQMPGATL